MLTDRPYDSKFHDVKTAAVSDTIKQFGFSTPNATLRKLLSSRNPDTSGGIMSSIKNVAKEGIRQTVFGDPYSAYREIKGLNHMAGGNLPAALGSYMLGSYYRRPTNIGTHLSNAMNLYGVGKDLGEAAFTDDPAERNINLGSAASRLLARPFTGRLGLLGIPVDMAVNHGARWLMGDRPNATPPIEYPMGPVENAGPHV